MRVEQLARRSFGLVATGLVGVALYFQAAGATELVVARSLLQPTVATLDANRNAGPRRSAPARTSTNGDVILALNSFDSVTGPLARGASQPASPGAAQPFPDRADPSNAPLCADVTVNIVSESSDPAWSIAQLAGPGDEEAAARRVGDAVGKLEVVHIGFDPAKLSPAVWLSGGKSLCHVLLFSEKGDRAAVSDRSPSAATSSAPAPNESRGRSRGSRVSSAPALPPEVADEIQRISDTELVVDRSVIDYVLENQARAVGSSRMVAEQKDGETVGIRVFGIGPDTLLGTLGLQNGDRLERINGYDIGSPVQALEAFAVLPTASSLSVQLTRRGKPTTLDIQIR